ncbi:BREX-1 system phosphatase PglZ type A [Ligilactobacillus saerimneri]|uniref:BREX-1 system phosphatase PglZ type A n=1 Tax=Ligilactobacillus saerimneri TaxID=228229 RepID=UPI0022A6AE03|nr:BREX-1 system phosphatase PglZ type A [Ligilactobacillus saerimneri]MCZ0892383.1 BREX-1 system phosphatase PglZ type A [Ligilactobacillus saerimneri]
MADTRWKKIITELNRYFDEGTKYVFWYDPAGQFTESVTDDSFTSELVASVIQMGPNEQFKTKNTLLANPDQQYLIYAPIERPALANNFLADMERYGRTFSADALDIIFQQLQEVLSWGEDKREFVRKYQRFFGAKKRRVDYIKRYDARLDEHPEYGILATLVRIDSFDETELLLQVLTAGQDMLTNKYILEFQKYGVEATFWKIYTQYFGVQHEPTLTSLLHGAIVTAIYSMLEQPVPSDLAEFKFEKNTNAQVFFERMLNLRHYGRLCRNSLLAVWKEQNLQAFLQVEPLRDLFKLTMIPQVNELILGRLRANFHEDGVVDVQETIIAAQIGITRSFNYRPHYGFLHFAALLLSHERQYYDDWQAMLATYVEVENLVDRWYRHLVDAYNSLGSDNRDEYTAIKRMVDQKYNDELLAGSVREWNKHFQLDAVDRSLRQESFYQRFVAGANERIVVIISDALRYEAAVTLQKILDRNDRITTKMDYMLTGLPSVTYMGMPALLPHHELAWDGKNVVVDDQLATDATRRRKILQAWNENNDVLELDDIKRATSKEIKQMIANKKVIYVYHNQIDATGDNVKTEDGTFKATREAIEEIAQVVQTLRTNSVAHIIVTADHGYIYREAEIEEQDKIDIPASSYTGKIAPRYLLTGDELPDTPGVAQTKLGVSLQSNDPTNVYYPKTANVFKAHGGKNYVHGGSSLQEMVVPVLDLRMNSNRSQAKPAELRLASTLRSINSLELSIVFNQVEAISDTVTKQVYHVFFEDADGRMISNEATITADRDSKHINEPYRVPVTIQDRKYDRSQDYYLVVRSTAGNEMRYQYKMDILSNDGIEF